LITVRFVPFVNWGATAGLSSGGKRTGGQAARGIRHVNGRGLLCIVLVACCGRPLHAADVPSPISPLESLQHFRLDPPGAIELVACEPQVVDPIAIRFDEDGRLWVVEMRDYPHGPKPGEPPLSRIRVLTDEDGDGRYETAHTFADHILFPTGLQPWKGGVIVTSAGQVVYLKDTDGDGRADATEVWFRGFAAENPQLRANHPRLGLDNRVYIANGLRGGMIEDPRRRDQKPLSISGMDFCFDPHSGDCEAVSGNGQFGLTFDDFGNRFVCNNRAPLDHVVLENRYLARNPFLAVPAVLATVAAGGEQSRVYPLSGAWTTSNLHAGQFTAACGVEIYRGDALGDEFRGNAFVCEPTGSLVHREVLTARGVSFVSKPARGGVEFLATGDAWFRPVNLEVGPDGALYVVDMYRAVIEHPQFMPGELQNRPDMRWGDDRGRIYRVVPAGAMPRPPKPKLSAASSAELVELLRHKNAWWRETAARLLLERQDRAVSQALEAMAAHAPEPTARVHALWALAGVGALSTGLVEAALGDTHPRVREQAVALAEPRLPQSDGLRQKVVALSADADARVRFRSALVLGSLSSRDVVGPLLSVALAQGDDPWTRRAVASALPQHSAPLLAAALRSPQLRQSQWASPELLLVLELAAVVGSRRDARELARLLSTICDPAAPASAAANQTALLGLAQGIERRGGSLAEMVASISAEDRGLPSRLNAIYDRALAAALDANLEEAVRAEHVDLLKYTQLPGAGEILLRIVLQDSSQLLRIRAAAALTAHEGHKVAPSLIAAFSVQTPAVRRAILDALVVRPAAAGLLLDAVQTGQIARAEIDSARENRLLQHANATIRQRSQKILAPSVPRQRQAVLAEYQASLELKSDPLAGKELFRKHCSTCHHVGDVGVDVAPDISDSRVKTPRQLLTDILNPNQAIDNNYISYTVVTRDGSVHTGIIAVETASSIALRQPENKSLQLLRADIETIRSNGVSLMPEGFEKNLSLQEMADLIAFIKNWRYLEPAAGAATAPDSK
jgi:putative membrane-bound dehydrogenase-like protein